MKSHEKNIDLQSKYSVTAFFYDLLDYPWERQYRQWRPALVGDLRGRVLEAGVGTGRNLEFYHQDVELLGIELSEHMLRKAERRKAKARCDVTLVQEDATVMSSIPSHQFDWVFSTFMCCVMPDDIQALALEQFSRVLKPGGRFRLLELVYSKNDKIRKKQQAFAPFVEKVYGARFDRHTLQHLERSAHLKVTHTSFLKDDTYLLIEGVRDS
ncbi:MAG: class I SAM-dependent methyltransferase [Gammaproteobacteria bacterium]|nr:class I SAM-dependent methyltransferase [Gammaproteobacteria bacterium]